MRRPGGYGARGTADSGTRGSRGQRVDGPRPQIVATPVCVADRVFPEPAIDAGGWGTEVPMWHRPIVNRRVRLDSCLPALTGAGNVRFTLASPRGLGPRERDRIAARGGSMRKPRQQMWSVRL